MAVCGKYIGVSTIKFNPPEGIALFCDRKPNHIGKCYVHDLQKLALRERREYLRDKARLEADLIRASKATK